jgi:hypothetical protein
MVVPYIYSTCWRMKSTFYERQQHHEATTPRTNLGIAHLTDMEAQRERERERESLADSRTGLNTVEASNRPLQTDHLTSGPTGHVNPIVDTEIISL